MERVVPAQLGDTTLTITQRLEVGDDSTSWIKTLPERELMLWLDHLALEVYERVPSYFAALRGEEGYAHGRRTLAVDSSLTRRDDASYDGATVFFEVKLEGAPNVARDYCMLVISNILEGLFGHAQAHLEMSDGEREDKIIAEYFGSAVPSPAQLMDAGLGIILTGFIPRRR
jgi:hypothetical protein